MAKTFIVVLSDKQRGTLTDELLRAHVDYLRSLRARDALPLCGPLVDNNRAVMILHAPSREDAEAMVRGDPFVARGYYQRFECDELLEAGDHNNWLADAPQTAGNLRR